MKRRDFIALVGGAAMGSPLQLRAQQPRKNARIGFLSVPPNIPLFAAANSGFSDELRQLSWIEGQNLTIEYRYSTDPGVDVAAQVTELVKSNIDVLVADGPEFVLQIANTRLLGACVIFHEQGIESPAKSSTPPRSDFFTDALDESRSTSSTSATSSTRI